MEAYRIAYPTQRAEARSISKQQWGVLVDVTFPRAESADGILRAWDLAETRGLDVFAGHVAIVAQFAKVKNKEGKERWDTTETCWTTIKAALFLAHKTGRFAGMDSVIFGPLREWTFSGYERDNGGVNQKKSIVVQAPEFATVTVYRLVENVRCAFTDTVFFDEIVPLKQGLPTGNWIKKPRLMLGKCSRASALRLAFPDCLDITDGEAEGQTIIMDGSAPNGGIIDQQSAEREDHQSSSSRAVTKDETQSSPSIDQTKFEASHQDVSSQPIQADGTFRGDSIDSFDDMPEASLAFLERNAQAARQQGMFEATIDYIRQSLDMSCHQLGIKFLNATKTVSGSRHSAQIWDYIAKAGQSRGEAFDYAKKSLMDAASNQQIEGEAAEAASVVLDFMKARANKAA
ncbi:hypothetical protein D2T29_12955 [Sinirhodobacter populi]|uniref:Phage recombination protein Bet n=1 Tax=Paenirhodobacter populi TaxID=2306993 RepID=A0A443KCQ1_9RHOB|nr:recombinase RecT [Sinirhodobacter populi]RWR30574.1 hypothetical protein D2T29_12955 [Sinirhodobacter populi]